MITATDRQTEPVSTGISYALQRHKNKWLYRVGYNDTGQGNRGIFICDNRNFFRRELAYGCFELAIMPGVNFRSSDLSYANFNGADLRHADFRGAKLTATRFTGASLHGANLTDVDLSSAIGINTDTVLLCAANEIRCYTPEEFLPEFPQSAGNPIYEEPNIGVRVEYSKDPLGGMGMFLRCMRHKEYRENLLCVLEALSHLTGIALGDLMERPMGINLEVKERGCWPILSTC